MIGQYLKDSLHWLHLFHFKPHSFMREMKMLSGWQVLTVYLKIYPWVFLLSLLLLAVIGLVCNEAGIPFNWQKAFATGILVGFVGLVVVLGSMLLGGIGITLFLRLILLGGSIGGAGVIVGIALGGGLGAGLSQIRLLYFARSTSTLIGGLAGGAFYELFIWLFGGQGEAVRFAAAYFPTFLISFALNFGRLYYWPFHLAQFWRAHRNGSWLMHFRHSPVHWDEAIDMPLPWLSDWLFEIAKTDRKEGLAEVLWVAAERPFQRKAAQRALLRLAVYDLTQFHSVAELSKVAATLGFLLEFEGVTLLLDGADILLDGENVLVEEAEEGSSDNLLPVGLSQARPYLSKISELADDYLKRQTPLGQHKALLDLQQAINRFAKAMALAPAPTGPELQRVAARWLQFINAAEAELRARLPFANPFIAGRPLYEDEEQFKGRHDLIIKIEEAIFGQRPSLLLYGRRKVGKTSTLLNLPRLLSSQFTPVFIDFQNAKWRDGDAAFCYHLAAAIFAELRKRKLADGLTQPQQADFQAQPFTQLDQFLDQVEEASRRCDKQLLLTFDEYERLAEDLAERKITREIFNQMRAIVQHRARFVVLFSGSHRFEELHAVNWSDYLINVKTLEIGFLAPDAARELLEQPVPEFAVRYEAGVVDEILRLTHCQPYLLQAVGSELMDLLNGQKRQVATHDDLAKAVQDVLVSVGAYFENNWRECSELEQAVLCALASGGTDGLTVAERQAALLGLSRKELIEQQDGQWRYTVELFRRWVLKNRVPAAALAPALIA